MGSDTEEIRGGHATRFLRSNHVHGGYGSWTRKIDARAYRGKRVRFSADVHSKAVDSRAGLWLRVDIKDVTNDRIEMAGFDNMQDRPIRGTTEWARYEVVLDVSQEATQIVYGALLQGHGTVWMNDPVLEIVSEDVPVTKREQ